MTVDDECCMKCGDPIPFSSDNDYCDDCIEDDEDE